MNILEMLRGKIKPDDPRAQKSMDNILELAVMRGRVDIVGSPTRLTQHGDVQYLSHQTNEWINVGRRIYCWQL